MVIALSVPARSFMRTPLALLAFACSAAAFAPLPPLRIAYRKPQVPLRASLELCSWREISTTCLCATKATSLAVAACGAYTLTHWLLKAHADSQDTLDTFTQINSGHVRRIPGCTQQGEGRRPAGTTTQQQASFARMRIRGNSATSSGTSGFDDSFHGVSDD